jgi:hypothetical protein
MMGCRVERISLWLLFEWVESLTCSNCRHTCGQVWGNNASVRDNTTSDPCDLSRVVLCIVDVVCWIEDLSTSNIARLSVKLSALFDFFRERAESRVHCEGVVTCTPGNAGHTELAS